MVIIYNNIMPKCKMKECGNFTQYKNTKHKYCLMHLARVRRHGYPELKKEKGEHAPHGRGKQSIRTL